MSLSLRSKQPKQSPQPQEQAADDFPLDTLARRSSNRVFYVFSAVLHIAALLVLSSSWLVWKSASQSSVSASASVPAKPAMARMAIDVGPIKFCEMNIESLVGQPPSQPRR